MSRIFLRFGAGETIPVADHLKNKKLKKYFNRETAAAVAAMGTLLQRHPVDTVHIPIYYATGLLEYEDYGLQSIVSGSMDKGEFTLERFIADGIRDVSPLSQFKILQNMPLCFVSIAFGFCGDNGVLYSSAGGLIDHGIAAPANEVMLGAGKTWADSSVAVGFALMKQTNLTPLSNSMGDNEAITLFEPGGVCG